MTKHLLAWTSAALLLGSLFSAAPAAAQALKGAGTCNDEYKANKPAIKAAKELKRDFISGCRALPDGTPTPIGGGAGAPATANKPAGRTSGVGAYKTAGQCNDEYKAAKPALRAAKETKKDFVEACRSLTPGTQTPINGGAAPAAVPSPSVAPAPAPAPNAPAAPAPTTQRQAPPPRAAPSSPTGANQFPAEASAKARCPGQTVVWVNTKSGIYHFAGTKNYGNTKAGAYMCETDATAAGDRASEREKHP